MTRRPAAPPSFRPQPVAPSIDALLGLGAVRRPMAKGAESLSSATFERVEIDGAPFVLKHLHCDDDWVMRATGDVTCRPIELWRHGYLDALPDCFDHTVVGVASGIGRHGWGGAVLMRDVGEHFVPDDDTIIPREQHERFLEHMAVLHATFWGFEDPLGITGAGNRLLLFNDWLPRIEAALQSEAGPPAAYPAGYAALAEHSPTSFSVARDVLAEPSALLAGLDATPSTFVHDDWKLGNLGSLPDGRTILVDWALPGQGAACSDLAWYLGVNCRRLPTSHDETIDLYRAALRRQGIDTDGWWDAQLGLALLGCFVQQGWSKAFDGRDDELAWWEERVADATRYLA